MNFHQRLKYLRTLKGQTQESLASVLGIKSTTIANYEADRNEPSFDKLVRLARHFNVTCDFLLGVSENCSSCIISNLPNEHRELLYTFRKLDAKSIEELDLYIRYLLYKQNQYNNM